MGNEVIIGLGEKGTEENEGIVPILELKKDEKYYEARIREIKRREKEKEDLETRINSLRREIFGRNEDVKSTFLPKTKKWRGAISCSKKLPKWGTICLFPDGTWESRPRSNHGHDNINYMHLLKHHHLSRRKLPLIEEYFRLMEILDRLIEQENRELEIVYAQRENWAG